MVMVLVVLLLPVGIVAARNPLATMRYSFIQGFLVVVYLAWLRFYLVGLVKKEV